MFKVYTFILGMFLVANMIFSSEGTQYGDVITLEEKTSISDILANPSEFEGKKVLVEGTVVGVCEMRGCWIELSGDKEFEKIRIKVNDGEIVFPMETKGKTALVEGEVFAFTYETDAVCTGNCQHKTAEGENKEEEGENHEKVSKTVYMIKGLGAVI
jgi:hypothetical protein